MVSTAATVTDAGVGCVATGRGGGDLCLRGREWITGEGGGLGRRRERAVRQVMFRAADQHNVLKDQSGEVFTSKHCWMKAKCDERNK